MGRIIAIANQKGGVGKTTTSINLSACIAAKGKKVLVIDIDPQGNTTSGYGIEKNELENTIYELILGDCSIEDCILKEVLPNISILPSNVNLAATSATRSAPLVITMNCISTMIKKMMMLREISIMSLPQMLSGD